MIFRTECSIGAALVCACLAPILLLVHSTLGSHLGNHTFLPRGPGLTSWSIQPLGHRSHLPASIWRVNPASQWGQKKKTQTGGHYFRPWIQLYLKSSRLGFLSLRSPFRLHLIWVAFPLFVPESVQGNPRDTWEGSPLRCFCWQDAAPG